MINIRKKSDCSGCHACAVVCPSKCISMVYDEEGFLYPEVDAKKCIKCGLCKKSCHIMKPYISENVPDAYACLNKNDKVRETSSSGGTFTLLAEYILEMGGVVFGASFDANNKVRHIYIDSKDKLYRLCSSKYIQSIIGDTYKQTKEILESNHPVLFSGTPCQISGLKSYLKKDYDDLYTCDIICHGVPSEKIWGKYIEYMEKLYGSKVCSEYSPSFRCKTYGWLDYSVKMHFENDDVYEEKHRKDLFIKAYLSNALLRPSCYECKNKGISRNSDITLGDFWGVNKVLPDMFDNKGTSLVFVNTEKGRGLFDIIKQNCVFCKTDTNVAVKYNPSVCTSSIRPLTRKKIMKNLDNWDFYRIYRECMKKTVFDKIYHRTSMYYKSKLKK